MLHCLQGSELTTKPHAPATTEVPETVIQTRGLSKHRTIQQTIWLHTEVPSFSLRLYSYCLHLLIHIYDGNYILAGSKLNEVVVGRQGARFVTSPSP